jgi:predicted GIY-YIG superfamily endonuclease
LTSCHAIGRPRFDSQRTRAWPMISDCPRIAVRASEPRARSVLRVMAGLVPAIHVAVADRPRQADECRMQGRLGLHHDEPATRYALRRCDERSCPPHLGTPRGGGRRVHQTVRPSWPGLTRPSTRVRRVARKDLPKPGWRRGSTGLRRLVYVEHHDDIRTAIQRERNLKHWPRAWKVRLILDANPAWDDLYDRLA